MKSVYREESLDLKRRLKLLNVKMADGQKQAEARLVIQRVKGLTEGTCFFKTNLK